MGLEGKVAVVSGSARGIGREFARRLAAEGARIVGIDVRDPEETLEALETEGHLAVRADISVPEAVDEVRRQVEAIVGCCDILVNNAGVYPPIAFEDLAYEAWRRVQAVNVDGAFLLSMAFAPAMRKAGWGRIINVGSSITLGRTSGLLPYIVSKGALHALTRALAAELGGYGVTVNAIAPSIVPTPGLYARGGGPGGLTDDEEIDLVVSHQIIPRRSSERDLSGMLAYLVSDEASFITGQVIHVDGGLTRSGA